jgi:outer membrane protein assembly factor BamB
MIFLGADNQLFYASKKGSGRKVWRFRSHGSINSTPSFSQGEVFFGDDEGFLYSLDLKTGKKNWERNFGSEILTPPAVSEGMLYVATVEGRIVAVNPVDGSLLWDRSHPIDVDLQMTIRGNSPPTLDDQGNLYVGFSDGTFWCLKAKTGKQVWQSSLPTPTGFRDIDGAPWIEGDRIYVVTFDGPLVALSRKNGKILWSQEIGSGVSLVSRADRLYVASSRGSVLAINKKEGTTIWQTKIGEGALTAPVLYNNILAVGLSSSTMNFINLTDGKLIARRFARKGISSHPILDGDRLYYFSNGGRLYSLKMLDGRLP